MVSRSRPITGSGRPSRRWRGRGRGYRGLPQRRSPPRARGEAMVRAYRDVLAIPGARALIGASAASQIGNWLYNAALLGYVYSTTRSAAWLGAATVCRLFPYVLFGPFGGGVRD